MTKTLKIKVLVALSDDGSWCAYGCKGGTKQEAIDAVTSDLGGDQRLFRWMTAEMACPDWTIPEVAAEMEGVA